MQREWTRPARLRQMGTVNDIIGAQSAGASVEIPSKNP